MRRVPSGFTIVEVILFFGVVIFMLGAIVASSSNLIAAQRYKDSVSSLQSFIQDLYFEVSNVRNQLRTETLSCNDKGEVEFGKKDSENRGRSKCEILGKYITVGEPSNTLNIYPVIGLSTTRESLTGTDLEILQNYQLAIIPQLLEVYSVEWGSALLSSSSMASSFTILVVLSPASGSIRTFINPSNNSKLDKTELINKPALERELLICVDDSNSLGTNMMGVKINAGATNGSAVEMIGDAITKANGGCA